MSPNPDDDARKEAAYRVCCSHAPYDDGRMEEAHRSCGHPGQRPRPSSRG